MIELARMQVVPMCPNCGKHVMFQTHATTVDELVRVVCYACRWEGVSRESVPQPKVQISETVWPA